MYMRMYMCIYIYVYMYKYVYVCISICIYVCESLRLLWKRASIPETPQILVCQAVIQAIVLYGLESAQLNPSHLQNLNAFQLRSLRQQLLDRRRQVRAVCCLIITTIK